MLAALGVVAAVEVYGLRHPRHGWTLTELTRYGFRTDTKAGRVAFVACIAALAGWFVPHILDQSE